jgi:hypothetical protein
MDEDLEVEKQIQSPKMKKLQKSFKIYSMLLKYLIRAVMSLDHVNIVANIMFIGTSLHKGVSVFDFFVILVDLLNLVYFQNIILSYYMKYKGMRTLHIK